MRKKTITITVLSIVLFAAAVLSSHTAKDLKADLYRPDAVWTSEDERLTTYDSHVKLGYGSNGDHWYTLEYTGNEKMVQVYGISEDAGQEAIPDNTNTLYVNLLTLENGKATDNGTGGGFGLMRDEDCDIYINNTLVANIKNARPESPEPNPSQDPGSTPSPNPNLNPRVDTNPTPSSNLVQPVTPTPEPVVESVPTPVYTNVTAKKLKFKKSSIKIADNDPTQLVLKTRTPSDADVFWASNKENIATVDAFGVVTGHESGKAKITAYGLNKKIKATCTVTVQGPKPVKSLKLSKGSLKLKLGETRSINATPNPKDARIGTDISWTVDKSEVVSITPNGNTVVIEAVGTGKAAVTATSANGKKKKCKITVK